MQQEQQCSRYGTTVSPVLDTTAQSMSISRTAHPPLKMNHLINLHGVSSTA